MSEQSRNVSPLSAASPHQLYTDQSYFQATEWIYDNVEKEETLPSRSPRDRSRREYEGKREDREISLAAKVKKRYLIAKDKSDPQYRRNLIEAIRRDPTSFYYYKQRRLSKPPEFQFKRKLRLPSLRSASPMSPSPLSAKPRNVPFTPDFKPGKKPHHLVASSLSPQRKVSILPQDPSSLFLRTLAEKCEGVKQTKEALSGTEREREARRRIERRLDWTRETLDLVEGCEAEVLIPFYKHQKEAMEEFHRDIHHLSELYRQSDSHQTSLHFHRLLRKNKNRLL